MCWELPLYAASSSLALPQCVRASVCVCLCMCVCAGVCVCACSHLGQAGGAAALRLQQVLQHQGGGAEDEAVLLLQDKQEVRQEVLGGLTLKFPKFSHTVFIQRTSGVVLEVE